ESTSCEASDLRPWLPAGVQPRKRGRALKSIPLAANPCCNRTVTWSSVVGKAMRRRDFIKAIAASAAVWPPGVRAQQAGQTYRVALLSPGGRVPNTDERRMGLVRALVERGYVEGRNLVFEDRFSEGRIERLPGLAAELNATKVD